VVNLKIFKISGSDIFNDKQEFSGRVKKSKLRTPKAFSGVEKNIDYHEKI